MLGTFILSAGYYDAYYQKAQKVRRLIRDKIENLLSQYDAILLPVTPTPAFKIGAHIKDPLVMYMEDIFTVLASLSGVPAISLPLGNNEAGLPLSVQVLAGHFNESALLNLSNRFLKSLSVK